MAKRPLTQCGQQNGRDTMQKPAYSICMHRRHSHPVCTVLWKPIKHPLWDSLGHTRRWQGCFCAAHRLQACVTPVHSKTVRTSAVLTHQKPFPPSPHVCRSRCPASPSVRPSTQSQTRLARGSSPGTTFRYDRGVAACAAQYGSAAAPSPNKHCCCHRRSGN